MKKYPIILLIIYFALTFFTDLSIADPVGYSDVHSAATRSDDKSRQALVSIFGEVVNNPLAGSGSGSFISGIFGVINGVLLVIGVVIAIYVFVRKLAKSSHDGTAFDRQSNSMWGPVNLLLGIAFLVPAPSGWSLSQLVMLWAASIMGIGSANLAMDEGLDAFAKGEGMIVQPATPNTKKLAYDLFEIELCKHAINQGIVDAKNSGALLNEELVNLVPNKSGAGFEFTNGSYSCGGAEVEPKSKYVSYGTFGDSSAYSLQASHNDALHQAHLQALIKMERELDIASKEFLDAILQRQENININLPNTAGLINTAAINYEKSIHTTAAKQPAELKKLAEELNQQLKKNGWMELGAWYQTFGSANTRLANEVAATGKVFVSANRGDYQFDHIFETASIAYETYLATGPSSDDAAPLGSVTNNKVGKDSNAVISDLFRSPGQSMTNWVVSFAENEDSNTVNPIIAFKNLGDYVLLSAETMTVGYIGLAGVVAAAKGFSVASIFTDIINLFTSAKDVILGVYDAISPLLLLLIGLLFTLGGFLSTYVPFIPFITWYAGLTSWLISLIIAVVGAPLWALCHLLPDDSEGLSSRTAIGYMTILDVMIRPLLMVIAFFLASAIVVVLGTILLQFFSLALKNAQFDSLTGVVSMFFYISLFVSVGINLIQSSFNLILVLPEKAIAMIGQSIGHTDPDFVGGTNTLASAARNRQYGRQGNLRDRGEYGGRGSPNTDGAKG